MSDRSIPKDKMLLMAKACEENQMTKYTTLDIHQAIDLVKAGCEDVEYKNQFNVWMLIIDESFVQNADFKWWIEREYHINTQALEEFNNLKQ